VVFTERFEVIKRSSDKWFFGIKVLLGKPVFLETA
jgi:hypothetical protein